MPKSISPDIIAPIIFGTVALGVVWLIWFLKRRGQKLTLTDCACFAMAGLCLAIFELGMIYGEHNQCSITRLLIRFYCG